MSLSTFSSHANYNDLITYGSSLNTSKLILVHGSAESKKCLAEGLRKAISERNKTFRVISSFMGMVVHL
jgi:metallo-beta-lactamase family protein